MEVEEGTIALALATMKKRVVARQKRVERPAFADVVAE